jgi:hypothetical protein
MYQADSNPANRVKEPNNGERRCAGSQTHKPDAAAASKEPITANHCQSCCSVRRRPPNSDGPGAAAGNFPELCAVANATEAFGKPVAWGWADTRCHATLAPFICRRPGE